MVEEQEDDSLRNLRNAIQQLNESLKHSGEEDKKKSKKNWRTIAVWGGGLGLILLGSVASTISAVWGYYNAGYKDGVASTRIQTRVECYHHQVQPGETINSVLSYFRTKDSSVTREAVLSQNGFTAYNLRTGKDITYCFEKK